MPEMGVGNPGVLEDKTKSLGATCSWKALCLNVVPCGLGGETDIVNWKNLEENSANLKQSMAMICGIYRNVQKLRAT